MLKIVKERTTRTEVEYCIDFLDEDDCGFSFPCDEYGNVQFCNDNAELECIQRENYDYAMRNKERFTKQYAKFNTRKYTVTDPAVGECKCGELVSLINQYQGACSCPKCGQWYNITGQELLDPAYWED